ncbi:MAG: multiprotein bridging factor aMBF1 [Candidatus Woesearchaeota archaeon]
MNCEMCGATNAGYIILVEGVRMTVCEECSKFGEIVKKPVVPKEKEKKESNIQRALRPKPTDLIEKLIPDYGNIIKKKREQLGLKQEDFAKMLNIKESVLHKIESERFKPDIEMAKHIEKRLKIKIVEIEKDDEKVEYGNFKNGTLTIGDVMIKKR